MEQNIAYEHFEALTERIYFFFDCAGVCVRHDFAEVEIHNAWVTILNSALTQIYDQLCEIKELMRFSFLSDKRAEFTELLSTYEKGLLLVRELIHDETFSITSGKIKALLTEGVMGFRHKVSDDEDYYMDLFNAEYNRYKASNQSRQEQIYDQDACDLLYQFPDDNQRKGIMLAKRRDQLFADEIGRIFHDNGRELRLLSASIVDMQLTDNIRINSFFDKYLAFEIANAKLEERDSVEIRNIVFKENVDVTKVMKQLMAFVDNKLITAQKHWYVVYLVFKEKKWLIITKQTMFREQINLVFQDRLKCTQDDFSEVDSYYKKTPYSQWSLANSQAPAGCETYIKIAKTLGEEFTEMKYAKPGLLINTKGKMSFR